MYLNDHSRREEGITIKRRKVYTYTRDPLSGKRVLTHRYLAEQALGRPLLSREVVHHRDGNSLNNDPSNLIVLPSQRVHAHAEFHARRTQTGMPSLFPEVFQVIPGGTQGTLFEHVLVWQGQEPPLRIKLTRPASSRLTTSQPWLLSPEQDEDKGKMQLLVPPPPAPGAIRLGELLA